MQIHTEQPIRASATSGLNSRLITYHSSCLQSTLVNPAQSLLYPDLPLSFSLHPDLVEREVGIDTGMTYLGNARRAELFYSQHSYILVNNAFLTLPHCY